MKKAMTGIMMFAVLATTSCKGGKDTPNGDSTGTGASGARVPGMVTKDTTKHDSTSDTGRNTADTMQKK